MFDVLVKIIDESNYPYEEKVVSMSANALDAITWFCDTYGWGDVRIEHIDIFHVEKLDF